MAKLNTHLNLLRAEYVKLQGRLADVEKDYQVSLASQGQLNHDNFVSKLLRTVAELFDSDLYRFGDLPLILKFKFDLCYQSCTFKR